jgi:hypothetical protein
VSQAIWARGEEAVTRKASSFITSGSMRDAEQRRSIRPLEPVVESNVSYSHRMLAHPRQTGRWATPSM